MLPRKYATLKNQSLFIGALCLVTSMIVALSTQPVAGQTDVSTMQAHSASSSTMVRNCSVQPTDGPSAEGPKTPSLNHLYWHLLTYQHFLDHVADTRKSTGGDADSLRRTIQAKLGFSDQEFAPIRTSASHLKMSLDEMNAQAAVIILEDRRNRVKGGDSCRNPPLGLSKLRALTAQREQKIANEIGVLELALGAKNSQSLKMFIINEFSKQVSIKQINPASDQVRYRAESHPHRLKVQP